MVTKNPDATQQIHHSSKFLTIFDPICPTETSHVYFGQTRFSRGNSLDVQRLAVAPIGIDSQAVASRDRHRHLRSMVRHKELIISIVFNLFLRIGNDSYGFHLGLLMMMMMMMMMMIDD